MAWVDALPERVLGDVLSAEPYPQPFYRKNWDNPFKYKLNRTYGDEFAYASFAQLASRWQMHTAVAADFYFNGASSIEWKASANTSSMLTALPPYDFEAVLEWSGGCTSTNLFPSIGILDVNGTGYAAGFYNDGNLYHMPITTYVYPGSPGNSVAGGRPEGNHVWLSVKRSGTNIQGRGSMNGTSFSSFATANTIPGTPVWLAIMRPFGGAGATNIVIHRFNVYAAPGYFPG